MTARDAQPPSVDSTAAAGPANGEWPTRALWIVLASLALARFALAVPGSMAAWGLNVLRFVPPVAGFTWWALSAFALVPALARRAEPFVTRAFEWRVRPGWVAYTPWVAGAAAIVWLFPDRLYFVGDFFLRENSSHVARSNFATLYPQGLPLDALLHDRIVRAVASAIGTDVYDVGRAIGVLEAGALGALAFHLSRVLELRGAAAFATSAIVLCGGYLSLFTGYNKAFAEMVLVTVAMGVFGLEAIRRGSGLFMLGIAFAMGLGLHRLALALLPAWLVTWALWLLAHGGEGGWRRRGVLVAAAIPLAALALMGWRLAHLVTGFDTSNFLSAEVVQEGGVLRAALSGTRLADLLDIMILLSPLAPVIALAPFLGRSSERRREGLVLAALVLPLAAFAPLFHPPQGLFRDWDALAATGAAISLLAAWTVGEALRTRARYAWLALPVALGALAPTAHWLLHNADLDRGLERIAAFVSEPPARTEQALGTAWDFLGMRYLDLGRKEQSADAFAHAAEITPSPKILRAWAASEVARGDLERARSIYRRLLSRAPNHVGAWLEYAQLSMSVRDTAAAEHAAEAVLRVQPGEPHARELLEALAAARR